MKEINVNAMKDTSSLPEKKTELINHHMDSRVWNDVQFRNGDTVIAAYAKSGK